MEVLSVAKNDQSKLKRKSIDSVLETISPFDESSCDLSEDDQAMSWLLVYGGV